MKLVICADLHITAKKPKYRKDDYLETLLKKLWQIVKYANSNDARLVIAGDIFDSPKVGYKVTNQVISTLSHLKKPAISCFGNHDTFFHSSNMENTPYQTLVESGIIHSQEDSLIIDNVAFHFLHWECGISKPVSGKYNILVGHISVYESTVPFWAEGDAYTPKKLQAKYPDFDCYLTGDIHTPFCKTIGNTVFINPGSMPRKSQDQMDYEPRVYLFDTEDSTLTTHYFLDILPAEDVFDIAGIEIDDTKKNKMLDQFADTLKNSRDGHTPSYRNNLNALIAKHSPPKRTVEIISECLEGK